MLDLDLKSLFTLLDPHCADALTNAAGACVRRGHYEVTVEHHLEQLLGNRRADACLLLDEIGVQESRLSAAIHRDLGMLRTGSPGKPVFSSLLVELVRDAWLLASVDLGEGAVRSGHLLLALTQRGARYAATATQRVFSEIGADAARRAFLAIRERSTEHTTARPMERSSVDGTDIAGDSLARFTTDLTAGAIKGSIDPVFCRDRQIRQVVDILARRRKNNPILVGDPGVGKTAIAEGLALLIASGAGPEPLRGVRLLSLDLGALEAGAGVRGEFERRLKGVIDEIKASPAPIVLFIDEAHNLVGGGGNQSGDAANLLKPALARGELRTIAATTWKEYKKYFEKDAALARRFELVNVPEPTPAEATIMLRGLAPRYAEAHGVHVQDRAVVAAVELSSRYLSGRQLPDKAIALLDTCATRVRLGQSRLPAALEEAERGVEEVERELAAHRADLAHQLPGLEDKTVTLEAERERRRALAGELRSRWEDERTAVLNVLTARRGDAPLPDAQAALSRLRGEVPLVHVDLGPESVAEVISEWTGIPVGQMMKDDLAVALSLEQRLGERVKGQDLALRTIAERVRQARARLNDPDQPVGVFLLVGPSGVGKTESALAVADLLFGGERSLVTVNMSEFQESHTVSRLIGSPPGYVGFGEGGELTEAVRQRPYSAVLLDECEKADRQVLNLFYQVFDKGVLSDGEGREVDFRNTAIFLTSNLASAEISALASIPGQDAAGIAAAIRPILSAHFAPALLARMTILPYVPLPPESLREITLLKLAKLARRVRETHRIELTWEDPAVDAIVARCTEVETGARNIDHILRGTLLPSLAAEILSGLSSGVASHGLVIGLDDVGTFRFQRSPAA